MKPTSQVNFGKFALVHDNVDLISWVSGARIRVNDFASAYGRARAQMVDKEFSDKRLPWCPFVDRVPRVGRDTRTAKEPMFHGCQMIE